MTARLVACLLLLMFPKNGAWAQESCVYLDSRGQARSVSSINQVPAQARKSARCGEWRQSQHLAAPQEVELSGTTRKESIASSLGRVELRWQRKIEKLFGRTPQRAVAEAMQAASRALKGRGFPLALQRLDVDWQMVFLDEELPETQIPSYLVSNCHPAWMTPPTNLYVVAQRVVAGCGGGSGKGSQVNDGELAAVLLHEIGHAVEYQLLNGRWNNDRLRAEGFAAWFEQYAAEFSPLIASGSRRERYLQMAQATLRKESFFKFDGSGAAYARGALIFHAVVDRKGFEGLRALYTYLSESGAELLPALQQTFGWGPDKVKAEALRIADESAT